MGRGTGDGGCVGAPVPVEAKVVPSLGLGAQGVPPGSNTQQQHHFTANQQRSFQMNNDKTERPNESSVLVKQQQFSGACRPVPLYVLEGAAV